jgi:hypothetical protein
MQIARILGAATLAVGCASTGGFPNTAGDPNAAIATARRQIAVAQDAGADSLARDALTEARREVLLAESQLGETHPERAVVSAQQAAASAAYAKALADRARANRDKAQADSALRVLPPPRAGR